MNSAAQGSAGGCFLRRGMFLAGAWLMLAVAGWANPPPGIRAAPTRPGATSAAPVPPASSPTVRAAAPANAGVSPGGALATKRFERIDYVSAADVARRLTLELTWLVRGRKLVLSAGGVRAELEKESREAEVNGLRVFLGDPVLESGGQLYLSRIDFERCLTPLLRPGFDLAARATPKVIVLDPGHGGRDTGTSVNEKVFALDVARRAKKLLLAAGFKVALTRDEDVFVDVVQRAAAANLARADVFVSIHFNALANDNRTTGVEVYTFPPANQHASGWWSTGRREDPFFETTDEPINRFDHWNVVLAQALHRHLVVDLKADDRGKKLMHLGVLRGLRCPGVLVECGFLTSEIEARKAGTPEYRQKIAEAIAAGVRDYAATR